MLEMVGRTFLLMRRRGWVGDEWKEERKLELCMGGVLSCLLSSIGNAVDVL